MEPLFEAMSKNQFPMIRAELEKLGAVFKPTLKEIVCAEFRCHGVLWTFWYYNLLDKNVAMLRINHTKENNGI